MVMVDRGRPRPSTFPLHVPWLLWLQFVLTVCCTAHTTLSDDVLRHLPDGSADFDIHHGALLAPILRPRVPGTPGSTAVLNHFVDFFRTTLPQWNVEFQNSTSTTPVTGDQEVPFVNLIATRDPPWAAVGEVERLTLVAHYDSKMKPDGFIGATDSAAPCAMIMHAARSVDAALTKKWERMQADGIGKDGFGWMEEERGLQILFLDGEEAFLSWTQTDSLSLAETWEHTAHPALSTYHNPLSSISLFVLLDLLGSSSPSVPSYFRTTHWAYANMAELESRLRLLDRFHSSPNHPSKRTPPSSNAHPPYKRATEPAFLRDKAYSSRTFGIEDDHLPFLHRGVDILHLIPSPFPHVWHDLSDDGEHLDLDTVADWATLVTAFVADWLELDSFLDTAATAMEKEKEKERGNADVKGAKGVRGVQARIVPATLFVVE
ncbi:MAG: hypothetical protein M1838_004250 [Thelocarpon superellum]|nr:MAG: hypothetical protein M1838_004250 [Thelocarpon superellum]